MCLFVSLFESFCSEVMTGIATKINPIARERHVDWIQCCRVGFGSVIALPPPVIQKPGRPPAYLSSHYVAPSQIPPGYRHQYRKKRSVPQYTDLVDAGNSTSGFQEVELAEDVPSYARKNFVSRDFNIHDHDVPLSDMRDLHEPLYQTLGVDGFWVSWCSKYLVFYLLVYIGLFSHRGSGTPSLVFRW